MMPLSLTSMAAPDRAAGGNPPAQARVDADPRRLKRAMADLVTTGSLEMGAHRPQDAREIAALLPTGTPVYVNHLPRHSLNDTLNGLIAVRDAGLDPVPHIAAKRVGSRQEIRVFLERAVRQAGVKKVLIIGGDLPEVAGPYKDATALLADDVIAGSGIREVAFAGYPEGHAHIPGDTLARALDENVAIAGNEGLGASIVTQFSFAPHRIVEFAATVARRAPGVPVYVGLAGPASPLALMKYAQICGVSSSLRAMSAAGINAVRLVTHTDPREQLAAIAAHTIGQPSSNIVGVHLYTFGSVTVAANWMNSVIREG